MVDRKCRECGRKCVEAEVLEEENEKTLRKIMKERWKESERSKKERGLKMRTERK